MSQTILLDLGTHGSVFTVMSFHDTDAVLSATYECTKCTGSKISSTLHIYQREKEDLFCQATILQRTYLGDSVPEYFKNFVKNNPRGYVLCFDNIKRQILHQQEYIAASNAPNDVVSTVDVVKTYLKLIKCAIRLKVGTPLACRIGVLIPACVQVDTQTFIQQQITEAFSDLHPKSVFFISENMAILNFCVQRQIYRGDSKVLLLNLGGMSSFSVIKLGESAERSCFSCLMGGLDADLLFIDLLYLLYPDASPQHYYECLQKFKQYKALANFDRQQVVLDCPSNYQCMYNVKQNQENKFGLFSDCYSQKEREEILHSGALSLNHLVVKKCFDCVIGNIIQNVRMNKNECGDISHALLVGGLCGSEYVVDAVRKGLQDCIPGIAVQVVPQSALAAIKGAKMLLQQSE